MDKKYEADIRGRNDNPAYGDPKFYVVTGPGFRRDDAVLVDTLNCDHMFSLDEQQLIAHNIADALNFMDRVRPALANWLNMQSSANAADLYRAAIDALGVTPVIPE